MSPACNLERGTHLSCCATSWSPAMQGRFLALAGFGNLPGDIVFFDKKSDGRCKQMGAVR